jgi:DNA-binding SARP family transcriptional activator
LLFDEGVVRLCLPPGSWVDHVVFTQLARTQRFEEALALWGGEPFSDDRYADWAAMSCEELRAHYLRTLLALAQQHFEAGEMAEARDLCRRLLTEEPWHEEAALLGMRACVALDDRVDAIRLYRTLEATLHDELGIAPQAALQALYQSLL